jgi:DnaD/phage-associated family protein
MGKSYDIFLSELDKCAELCDATAEELRLLLALIAEGGELESEERLAERAKITVGRARASLRFWLDAGIIAAKDDGAPRITEEHKTRVNKGELIERDGQSVAKEIRENDMKPLFDELCRIFERPITTAESKIVAGTVEQYGVSREYLISLAAFLKGRNRLTVTKLRDTAITLSDKGIDTLEALEIYICEREKELKCEWEIKRVLGIYDRVISPSERKYFKAWSEEMGFGSEIIAEAYDITVMQTGKRSLPYMNEILSAWNKAGLKTPEECRRHSEEGKPEEKAKPRRERKSESKPRYGNFDIDEAFKNALLRSYGDEDAKK